MPLTIPSILTMPIEAHKAWLRVVDETKMLMERDADLQIKAAKGLRIQTRALPPEVLGLLYGKYCSLANRMYRAYVDSEQLQRAPYISEVITITIRRLLELRKELVDLFINDYIYVDAALIAQELTPQDIEIVVPCHFAIDMRKDTVEELLQTMWAESIARMAAPSLEHKSTSALYNRQLSEESVEKMNEPVKEPSIIPEEYIRATLIQSHERYRQYFMQDYKAKCIRRRTFFAAHVEPAPMPMRIAAATLIQRVYRRFMELKRKKMNDYKRDVLLGIIPDPWKEGTLNLREENEKLYRLRRRFNERTRQVYIEELERENMRLVRMKKDMQMDDITDQIREWFREWLYGYGFFPEYPYPAEGGTILVINGKYPSIAEKIEMDEKFAASNKGKTKEQLKAAAKQAKYEAAAKAEAARDAAKKLALQEYRLKCSPLTDLGYQMKQSENMDTFKTVLERYIVAWSEYDHFPPESHGEVVYGFIKTILSEDVMCQLHVDCRQLVDELMRLELKLLISAHKRMFEEQGKQYPAMKPRPKPPPPPVPQPLPDVNDLVEEFKYLFDLGIISKPTGKLDDIIGDSNYAAYENVILDPWTRFLPPGYGDVRRRLVLSCVFGAGFEPGTNRNRSVLLLGPPRNGKSFLIDCLAGEMNAVKIDISPEMFSAVVPQVAKTLELVFEAARVFQPCVVYFRNIERVYLKGSKIPREQRHLNAGRVKAGLVKCVKKIAPEDKVIFIATCSNPSGFDARPMMSMFDEKILVPRTDYGSLQMFFYHRLQSIRSIERDFCVHTLAQMLQGYGFGAIIEVLNKVMSDERIVRLNVTPFSEEEVIIAMAESDLEQLSVQDYQLYEDFFIKNSVLNKPRVELADINRKRAEVYAAIERKKKKKKKNKE